MEVDLEVDMVADMEVDMVADLEVDMAPTWRWTWCRHGCRQGGLNFFDKKLKPGLRIFQALQVYSATIRSICFYLFV